MSHQPMTFVRVRESLCADVTFECHINTFMRVRESLLCLDVTFELILGLQATNKQKNLNVAVDVMQQQGQRRSHTFIYMHTYV
jgi:hypothetical protein